MNLSVVIIIFVALFALGALLAARAGIRSIQFARKVVFYRTRQAYMATGWQWLIVSGVLTIISVGSGIFGQRVVNQIFPPPPTPTATLTSTPLPTATDTPSPTSTETLTATLTPDGTLTLAVFLSRTPTFTATLTVTPSPTLTPSVTAGCDG